MTEYLLNIYDIKPDGCVDTSKPVSCFRFNKVDIDDWFDGQAPLENKLVHAFKAIKESPTEGAGEQ